VKTTSFVCLADVADGECSPSNSVAQFSAGGSNRVIIDIGDMSANLINAVVAAEDRSFFTHGGVDPWGIARALYRDLRGSASRQGGSTITQQYVKSVYLTADRTPERKLKEAAIAIKLERKLTRSPRSSSGTSTRSRWAEVRSVSRRRRGPTSTRTPPT
jgi:hypothetical protein